MSSRLLAVLAVVAVITTATAADRDNWPMFRGLTAGVIEDDPTLPESWSATANVAWRVNVPGLGWSSPIVWGDYIFVTSAISSQQAQLPRPGLAIGERSSEMEAIRGGYPLNATDPSSTSQHRWMLFAFDFKTGKLRWERLLHSGIPVESKHLKNTFASETPVTDGRKIYVYIGDVRRLVAVDFGGKLAWSTEIRPSEITSVPQTKQTSGELINLGTAASPALHDGKIYVQNDHVGTPAGVRDSGVWFLAALDTQTGKEIWRLDEAKERGGGWSTPYVWTNPVRTELVVMGNYSVRSYDPASGTLLWKIHKTSENATPTPFASNGLLFASAGYPPDPSKPVYAIRPGAHGDISLAEGERANDYIAWSHPRLGSYMASALAYKGTLYHLQSVGLLTANDALTGKTVYGRQRIASDAGTFTASPWAYNDKIFALSEDGDTYVIQAGPTFKVLGKNSLGQMVLATPAVVRSSIIIRTSTSLWRIAKPGT